MSGQITTHALDTAMGGGAGGLKVAVRRLSPEPADLGEVTLDGGGRGVLVPSGALRAGVYELTFKLGDYRRAQGMVLDNPPFLDEAPVRFGVSDPAAHWHVPLLFSPFGYTTYRGG
ncbi:MAG TPA: hydroxyisourate hydrolase [Caulobacteraceae bacterium]|nr:hydroxyisourate hydrolase [Caulobacteraceae bacterium]